MITWTVYSCKHKIQLERTRMSNPLHPLPAFRGILEMRGSMAIRLWPCMTQAQAHPPPFPSLPSTLLLSKRNPVNDYLYIWARTSKCNPVNDYLYIWARTWYSECVMSRRPKYPAVERGGEWCKDYPGLGNRSVLYPYSSLGNSFAGLSSSGTLKKSLKHRSCSIFFFLEPHSCKLGVILMLVLQQ